MFQLARPGSQHHLGEHQGPARRQCDQYRAAAQCTTLAAAQNSEDVNESVDVTDINDEVDADATVSDAGVVQCAEINVAADPVANVNVDITVDTAASELVDVEVNDQEVQHRKVRGLLPPWSSDGLNNIKLMLSKLICGRMC